MEVAHILQHLMELARKDDQIHIVRAINTIAMEIRAAVHLERPDDQEFKVLMEEIETLQERQEGRTTTSASSSDDTNSPDGVSSCLGGGGGGRGSQVSFLTEDTIDKLKIIEDMLYRSLARKSLHGYAQKFGYGPVISSKLDCTVCRHGLGAHVEELLRQGNSIRAIARWMTAQGIKAGRFAISAHWKHVQEQEAERDRMNGTSAEVTT